MHFGGREEPAAHQQPHDYVFGKLQKRRCRGWWFWMNKRKTYSWWTLGTAPESVRVIIAKRIIFAGDDNAVLFICLAPSLLVTCVFWRLLNVSCVHALIPLNLRSYIQLISGNQITALLFLISVLSFLVNGVAAACFIFLYGDMKIITGTWAKIKVMEMKAQFILLNCFGW